MDASSLDLSYNSSRIELEDFTSIRAKGGSLPENQSGLLLSLRNAHFGWNTSSQNGTGITLDLSALPTGSLIAIIGPVGSGKSTFLKGIANETSVLDGEAFIKYPDLAFCEQTPWLTNSTIRENILGENTSLAFDAEWYRIVVRACALDLDFKTMPAGDETPVGSKGSKLSGGQKQRIVSGFLFKCSGCWSC
jgi:ABC-type multidrug transport system fused ATPase/permease subunit